MEIIHSRSSQQVDRALHIVDGPVLPHPASTTGKKFRLDTLSIRFAFAGNEWHVTRLAAQGAILKADGTDSKIRFNDDVYYWEVKPEWQIVHAFIDGVRPTGAVDLPFGPFKLKET